jgi:Glycosyltransferase family 87
VIRRAVPIVLGLLAAAVTVRYIGVTWLDRISPADVLPARGFVMSDFHDAVWLPAKDLLAGFDPYDDAAFLARHPGTQGYSPYTPEHLLLVSWLGALSWPVGALVWALLGGLALAGMGAWSGPAALRLARPAASRTELWTAAAAGVLLVWIWRPTSTALGLGQPSSLWGPAAAVAAAATVLPFLLGTRARTALTVLAIAKPQTGIQLALTAGVARQWRALAAGFAIACALSLAVGVWIAGPGGVVGWVLGLPGAVAGHHSRYDQAFTAGNPWIDIWSTAHRMGLPDVAGLALAVLVLALGIAAAVVLRRRERPGLGALTAMTTGLLVVPHCGYDLLLLFPVLLLAGVETWAPAEAGAATNGTVVAPARTDVPFVAQGTGRGGAGRTVTWAAFVPLVLSGLVPNVRPAPGLEPELAQAVLLLAGFALLVAAAVLGAAVRQGAAARR